MYRKKNVIGKRQRERKEERRDPFHSNELASQDSKNYISDLRQRSSPQTGKCSQECIQDEMKFKNNLIISMDKEQNYETKNARRKQK